MTPAGVYAEDMPNGRRFKCDLSIKGRGRPDRVLAAFHREIQGRPILLPVSPFGVPVSQYIDDRNAGPHLATGQEKAAPPLAVNPEHAAPSLPVSQKQVSPETQDAVELQKAQLGAYILCKVLIDLGYFLELKKSVWIPAKVVKFLGMLVWSVPLGLGIPGDKIQKFGTLREYIAEQGEVDVPKELREEIIHWRVVDDQDKMFPWVEEKHIIVQVITDASSYAWAGVIKPPGSQALMVQDYRTADDFQAPIHVKEAKAIALTLRAAGSIIENARVILETDTAKRYRRPGKGKRGKTSF
ncbi:hypothetical protein Bbelb_386210 [Branchiostoma belcheri]|nr:hypothetical protein Bbelb_386210 [Branchiostoma belcheri]